jgi:hypothetical protein
MLDLEGCGGPRGEFGVLTYKGKTGKHISIFLGWFFPLSVGHRLKISDDRMEWSFSLGDFLKDFPWS